MKKTQRTLRKDIIAKETILHMSFELSNSKWKLGFSDGNKMRFKSIDARNLEQLEQEIEKAKSRFRLDNDAKAWEGYLWQ